MEDVLLNIVSEKIPLEIATLKVFQVICFEFWNL